MKRTGDIYPYSAKTLLLKAEILWGKIFLQGDLRAGGTVSAEEHLSACVWGGPWKESGNHLSSVPLQLRALIATGMTQIRHQTKLSKGQETAAGE